MILRPDNMFSRNFEHILAFFVKEMIQQYKLWHNTYVTLKVASLKWYKWYFYFILLLFFRIKVFF